MEAKVGFTGLGDMGFPMARRLLNNGYVVHNYAHRRREGIDLLKTEGLVEQSNPREVGCQVDILITTVVDDKQTDSVLSGVAMPVDGDYSAR
jgi:3-hydroxyisobutyrate dehydrogenase-like beta-hydroxyacid dehydrogenase